jgi:RNA polymerase sigma-70 factor (ECF subfamily)
VARFVTSFPSHFWADATLAYIQANGQSAVLLSRNGSVFAFATVEVTGDNISKILWVMSPAKLALISRSWPGFG